MAALVVHAWKDTESMRALFIKPAIAVSNARKLVKDGWQVHVTDADGRMFHPDRFDDLLKIEQKVLR